MEVNDQLHILATFTKEKNFQYPLNMLGGHQSWSRCLQEEKNSLCRPQNKPQIAEPVAQLHIDSIIPGHKMKFASKFVLKVNFQNLTLLSTSVIIQLLYSCYMKLGILKMIWIGAVCCVHSHVLKRLVSGWLLNPKHVQRVDGNKGYSCANSHNCCICIPNWL